MNFKRQLIGPEVPTPQMFDDVVKDREIGGGGLQIKGFAPQEMTSRPVPIGVASINGNRHVFPVSNRTGWDSAPHKFRIGSSDD